MSGSDSPRAQILAGVRQALARAGTARDQAAVDERLAHHRRNLTPARAALPVSARIELFRTMVREVSATVEDVADLDAVPAAVARYLASHNLPAELRAAPALVSVPWSNQPTLNVAFGRAGGDDHAGVTGALAGVAETGTLMLASGADHPTTLNFLPDTHVVVLRADDVVAGYEDGWDRVRAAGAMPRTVNFVTGPSRTGDIEQKIQLGAHGPRRLHIVIVGAPDAGGDSHGSGGHD